MPTTKTPTAQIIVAFVFFFATTAFSQFQFNPIDNSGKTVGQHIEIIISTANGADPISFVAIGKPIWATFTDLGNNTAKIEGTPLYPDINPDASKTFNFNIKATDNLGSETTTAFDIVVSSDGDKPVVYGQAILTTNEDQSIDISDGHLIVTDKNGVYPSGHTFQMSSGTNHSISGNTIVPNENFNGTLIVPTTVSDGSLTSNPFNLTVSVTPVDDAPVVSGIEAGTLAYTENGGAVAISSSITVTDAENDNLNGATVAISANYDTGKDFLDYTETNGITGSYENGTLTLSGNASPANYTAALRAVMFRNDSDNPSSLQRTVTFTIAGGSFQTRALSVTPVDDAPVVSGIEAGTLAYTENGGAVAISSTITVHRCRERQP
jgi:hypothetical protein